MTVSLRIIDDLSHSPAFNMAADLYCIDSCRKQGVVLVRLYEWQPACITIGYMQKPDGLLEMSKLERDDVAWIRRPTGGRAVLHAEDITFSCVFPLAIAAMGKNVMEAYSIISRCLMAGLGNLGIECDSHDSFDDLRETKRDIKLPCFLAPNRKEIMVNGKKLVGSAQKRSAQAVLQHGSIPFTDAYRRLPEYLQLSEDQRRVQKDLLTSKSTCLKEIDPALTITKVRSALIKGFTASLPFVAMEKPWTDEERMKIQEIADSVKFRNQWLESNSILD